MHCIDELTVNNIECIYFVTLWIGLSTKVYVGVNVKLS